MDSVGKECQFELASFQRCILANNGNQMACKKTQQELANCAANAVPMLQTIKQTCGSLIQEYDQCLFQFKDASQDVLAEKCTPRLQALSLCANAVKAQTEK
ncbi:mitochondrial intermembrane space protein [Malassezia pachydermatis]